MIYIYDTLYVYIYIYIVILQWVAGQPKCHDVLRVVQLVLDGHGSFMFADKKEHPDLHYTMS